MKQNKIKWVTQMNRKLVLKIRNWINLQQAEKEEQKCNLQISRIRERMSL